MSRQHAFGDNLSGVIGATDRPWRRRRLCTLEQPQRRGVWHSQDMQLPQIKIALIVAWVLSAIVVLIGSAQVTSMSHRLALVVFGVLPPLVLWFWWNDPSQTMSESIHQVRDEGGALRRPTPID